MARPSKLTPSQWEEILRRVVDGESIRSLAKEYGVGEATIRERVSAQAEKIKTVANQIVKAEEALNELPISAQITAQGYAAQLRAISDNLTGAALNQSKTSKIISKLANAKAETLSVDSHEGDFKEVAIKIKLANEASAIPVALLNANKEVVKNINESTDDKADKVSIEEYEKARLKMLGQY